jgi:hypothetical protein
MPQHATRTSFKPGQSGNPNGRPKQDAEFRAIAQAYGVPGLHKLAELGGLTDKPPAVSETARILAINSLLDRGHGKPTLPLAVDGEVPAVIEFRWAPAEETLEAPTPALTIDAGDADADDATGEPLRVVWSSD